MSYYSNYKINEGTISIPNELQDKSVNILASPDRRGVSISIARDKLPSGQTFEGYAISEMTRITEALVDYKETSKTVIQIDGIRCPLWRFSWKSPQGVLYQHVAIFERNRQVVVLTASFYFEPSASQIKEVKDIFSSFKSDGL